MSFSFFGTHWPFVVSDGPLFAASFNHFIWLDVPRIDFALFFFMRNGRQLKSVDFYNISTARAKGGAARFVPGDG